MCRFLANLHQKIDSKPAFLTSVPAAEGATKKKGVLANATTPSGFSRGEDDQSV